LGRGLWRGGEGRFEGLLFDGIGRGAFGLLWRDLGRVTLGMGGEKRRQGVEG